MGSLGIKECKDTGKVLKIARQNHLEVCEGKGDHFQLKDPRSGEHVTIYHKRELSIGVAHQVLKFFLRIGVVVALLFVLMLVVVNFGWA